MRYLNIINLCALAIASSFSVSLRAQEAPPHTFRLTDSDGQVFENEGWRNDLIFGEVKDEFTEKTKWGLVADNRLMKIMSGRWKAAQPDNERDWHGYHIPQHIIPQIPLTVADAINPKLYNTEKKYAIEAKRMKLSPHLFTSHGRK